MTNVKFSQFYLTVAGKRTRVSYNRGPWVEGVNPATIKIRPFPRSHFGADVRKAFAIENNSDMTTDYFEADCIRLVPGHPHYEAVAAVAPH